MTLNSLAGEQEEVVEQLFRCTQLQNDKRTLDHQQFVSFVKEIHSSVTRQYRGDKAGNGDHGGDKLAEPKSIPWKHGLLEIDVGGNTGTLSYSGQQSVLNSSSEIGLVKFLVQRFEQQCTYEELRGAMKGDLKDTK